MPWCTYLLTYIHRLLGCIKLAISPKRLKIERKLHYCFITSINWLIDWLIDWLTAYIKSYTCFRLPPKCMTLNNLWARFKVIDSFNAAKMAKYSLVMTPTRRRRHVEWLDALYLYSYAGALTYLLTYTDGSGRIKPAISPKQLKIERKLLLTAYILYTINGL